ncbi:vitellogenin 3, phosvitinless [Syngnathus scovelli]|uniref:vitellogenin 3, phosvitinless n=1 Tax=Syngnathus scovelli TaxID=161590 RepID=UPI0021106D2F|nr:vitellogenin 3, phosvitinless [Syngnathus scovelli]
MRGFILCCLVALAACESVRYDFSLNPKKSYEYKYEGLVNFGLGMPNMAESGAKLTCKIKIVGASAQSFSLQIADLAFEEFNGFPGKDSFIASAKLTQRIAAQLVKPFMFDFASGHVGNIHASAEVSDTVVNIVRGILSFFHVTVKTTQTFYELEEAGIHGMCKSNYAVEENKETRDMTITQVVDVTNCREKAERYSGMATAVLDDISKKRGDSLISTMRYVYTIKPTTEGGLISRAHGLEQQHFSPFNVKGGSFKMKATKELVLLDVRDKPSAVTGKHGPMENRGNIIYKFVKAGAHLPILMQKSDDASSKAVELIKHLAEVNKYQIESATTEDVMKLYQLLRLVPYEGLEAMWKQFAAHDEYRRWFLDTIVEVNDARILKFLQRRFQERDITVSEAVQTLLLAFDHLDATPELVEMAKSFLNMPYSKSNIFVWHTVALSYGSLVYKHCAYYTPCPVSAVQPLLDFALDSMKNNNEKDMVLALKALGNAGHPGSTKTIMRFLPGVSANPVDLPPRVLSAAVQALRLIASRDPHSVQQITMSLYLQKDLCAELRMLALMILFDTKPSMALVSTVTAHLQEEKNLHVISFTYSYLRSMARSRTPDNPFLSTACNVAVKILAPKFGRITHRFSKAFRLDWFNDDLLLGTAGEFFMLRNATENIPTEIMMKGKLYFIGRIIQLLEMGVRSDGIKQMFAPIIPQLKGDLSDLQIIYRQLQNLETSDKPLLHFYSRASGQEWFFADINKEHIHNIMNAVNPSAGKNSAVWTAIENLQKGISWHRTKAFLIFETRYFQATTLGLPVEISKYYQTLNGITVNAKAAMNPPLTDHLGQLLTSEISLETDGFIGCTKDIWLSYGINTELFHSGVEFKSKIPYSIPWKLSAKINIRERKFELDIPLSKKDVELISVSSDVYVVSRNIETPALPKRTPMMPKAIDSNDKLVRKDPSVAKLENEGELHKPNNWHPRDKWCTQNNIYGSILCVESELRRAYYHDEYPLYYLLGYTNVALKAVPVQTNKPVEKIRFEVNADPIQHPSNTQELLESLRKISKTTSGGSSESVEAELNLSSPGKVFNSTPEAIFNVKALAMSGNQKPEGYETAVYYTSMTNLRNTQVIVSQVGHNTNWKMCIDTVLDGRTKAKASLRWGAECQSFEMFLSANTSRLPCSKPTLRAKVHWTRIPATMSEFFTGIKTYIPGMAFLLGFNQQFENNPRQELSASVVASSSDSIDVRLRFPEYTVYRQSIPVPLPRGSLQELQYNTTM